MLGMARDVNVLIVVPKFNPGYVLLFCLFILILLVHVFRSSFRHGKTLDSYALHICIHRTKPDVRVCNFNPHQYVYQ